MFPFSRKRQSQASQVGVQVTAQPAVEQRSDDPWSWAQGWGNCSVAAVDVSPFNALSCPPVLAAVNLIASIKGTLPVNVFRPADGAARKSRPIAQPNPLSEPTQTRGRRLASFGRT